MFYVSTFLLFATAFDCSFAVAYYAYVVFVFVLSCATIYNVAALGKNHRQDALRFSAPPLECVRTIHPLRRSAFQGRSPRPPINLQRGHAGNTENVTRLVRPAKNNRAACLWSCIPKMNQELWVSILTLRNEFQMTLCIPIGMTCTWLRNS